MVPVATTPPDPSSLMPRRLGSYALHYEIGRGGMASVYMARDVVSGRLVALKVMHAHLSGDPSYTEMFIDEADLARRIRHPNVCAVEEWGTDDGRHYMVQELLAGETLWTLVRDRARAKRIRSAEWVGFATSIVVEMLEGLHAAHEAVDEEGRPLHAIHRDVSPHNVVVSYDGTVKVVDFGIAKAAEREKTQVGLLKGKVGYVAPEQIIGADFDRGVDIWAAGVTLWEALAGRFLFRAKGALPTLRAVRDQVVVPPSQWNPYVPRALDDVVLWALSRERDARPRTALEMANALRRAVSTTELLPSLLPDREARANWMEWEYVAEKAHHEHIRGLVLENDDENQNDTEVAIGASGMRLKTQLVSMAEIIPIEDTTDITAVDELLPLDDDRADVTQIIEGRAMPETAPMVGPAVAALGCAVLALAVGVAILLLVAFSGSP